MWQGNKINECMTRLIWLVITWLRWPYTTPVLSFILTLPLVLILWFLMKCISFLLLKKKKGNKINEIWFRDMGAGESKKCSPTFNKRKGWSWWFKHLHVIVLKCCFFIEVHTLMNFFMIFIPLHSHVVFFPHINFFIFI